MCGGCDKIEKRELLLEKVDDYNDDKRAEAFNAWKECQCLYDFYVEYIKTLDKSELIELIIDECKFNYNDRYFNDYLREIYNDAT